MNPALPLLLGLILGWLIEWLIDWFFWRPDRERLKQRLTEAELELNNLRLEVAEERQLREKTRVVEAVANPRTVVEGAPAPSDGKLAAAEASLSSLWARVNEYQAQLAAREAELGQLRVQLADDQHRRAALASAQAQLASLRKQLAETLRGRGEHDLLVAQAEGAPPGPDSDRAALEAAEAEIIRLQRKTVELEDELSRAPAAQPPEDDIIRITGIGPVFAERLKAAGIRTFKDIAESSPARLKQIAGVRKWQKIDPDLWIAEAVEFASGKRQ